MGDFGNLFLFDKTCISVFANLPKLQTKCEIPCRIGGQTNLIQNVGSCGGLIYYTRNLSDQNKSCTNKGTSLPKNDGWNVLQIKALAQVMVDIYI